MINNYHAYHYPCICNDKNCCRQILKKKKKVMLDIELARTIDVIEIKILEGFIGIPKDKFPLSCILG